MAKAKDKTAKPKGPPVDGTPEDLLAYWRASAIELGLRDTTAAKMELAELMEYAQQILAVLGSADDKAALETNTAATEAVSADAKALREEFRSIRGEMYAAGTRLIKIAADQNSQEEDVVFIGVNGYPFYIKRGHEVKVPLAVIEVLENAVIKDGKMKIGGVGTRPEMVFKDIPRFSWNYTDDGRRAA